MLHFWYLVVLLMLLPLPANAKPTKAGPPSATTMAATIEHGRFSAAERHIIRKGLLQGRPLRKTVPASTALPKGMAKKFTQGKQLPAGWRKKITLGRRLDFIVYRSGSPLPGATLQHLLPAPAGTEIIRVENSIIRLQANTRIVLDIFDLLPR